MKTYISLLLFPIISFSQSFTDKRDGQVYAYTELGGLNWMTENLRYDAEDSVCLENCDEIRFYDYRYLEDVCPQGWRLPEMMEWDALTISFEGAEKVRMLEENVKVYRVNFLDKFNIFESNLLNIDAYGRMEGGQLKKGSSIDYWTVNQDTDDRFHMHFTPYTIMGHAHKHHLKPNKEEEFRMFPIRCVSESN